MHLLKSKWLSTTLLASVILLQGCGWHLRGAQALPPELKTLHLKTASDNSKFSRSLKRSLKAMDVSFADSTSGAPYTLSVSGITPTTRTLSTTGSAKVAEYELTSTITYAVHSREGEQLIAPTQISTEKTYLYNSNNAVSSFEEESLLREEMQRELVQQLIRRYRAISPTPSTVVEDE
ncbi:MAG: LPS assembly lipoprotein LptE [Pseudomonadales bacterium]